MERHFNAAKEIWKLVMLVFLIIVTFSYAMFQGGFVSWFLFYSFLPFAVYALGLSFYTLKDMKAERIFPKREFNSGEKVRISVLIERNTPFPLFYAIAEEQVTEELGSKIRNKAKSFLHPVFHKVFHFEYTIEAMPRGEHFFNSIRLKTGDPLGLIEKEVQIPVEDKIVVYPKYVELLYKPFEHQFDQGMTASKERVQRDTSMVSGVREYQPGDRFSWINWKATARRNDIMVKEFEQRQSHDILIMMDCAPDSRFEIAVSFTASIIRAILRKGAQVGLITSSHDRIAFPIKGGDSQQQQLLYHLAKITDNSQAPFEKVIEAEVFLNHHHSNLLLVTAQLSKGLVERAGRYSQKGGLVTIFLIKKEEESTSKDELGLKSSAAAKGIRVVMIHDKQFKDAFSEVSRA